MKTFQRILSLVALVMTALMPINSHAVFVVQSSGPTNNTAGLALWWPLDEGSGAATADASGNGFGGTLYNSAAWIPGLITNGVSLNGSTSDYVGANGPATLMNGLPGATLSCWIKTTSGFTIGFNDTKGSRFSIECSGGQVYWCVENGAMTFPYCAFKPDENWHWFVLSYNDSAPGLSSLTAYIDGAPQTLTSGGTDPSGALSPNLGSFTIARTLVNSIYYTMSCDDVRLYNRALSFGEVTNQYEWPSGGRKLLGPGTYYVDSGAGSDANDGSSTNTPWQHHPFMVNWSGTAYSHVAGDTFIFKGGDVWDSNCFGPTYITMPWGGVAGSSDTYTVNSNWFNGASFTRPALDGGYWAETLLFVPQGVSNINFNSLEMRNVMIQTANFSGLLCYNNTHDITATNCLFHGWRLTNSITQDGNGGGVIGNFNSGYGITNIILDHCEIENAENGPSGLGNGNCVEFGGQLNYCLIHDNVSAILFAQDVNHCVISNIDYPYGTTYPADHNNGFYMDNANGNAPAGSVNTYCRNTVFCNTGSAANMAFAHVEGYNAYIYNCLFYGVMSAQAAINTSTLQGTGVEHSVYVYNNTIVVGTNDWPNGIRLDGGAYAGQFINNFWITNNLFIGTYASTNVGSSGQGAYVMNLQSGNNFILTSTQATTLGYSPTNLYAPIASSCPTVGVGANLTGLGLCTSDISGNPRPITGAWDVGAHQYYIPSPGPPPWSAGLRVVAGP